MAGTLSRFGFWILLIFGLGFWAGRMSTARWKMEIVDEKGIAPNPASTDGSAPVDEDQVNRGARRAIENITSKLGLTPEQVSATKPIFMKAGQDLAKLPKLSPQRLSVFHRFQEELKPHLTEKQRMLSEEIMKKYSKQS